MKIGPSEVPNSTIGFILVISVVAVVLLTGIVFKFRSAANRCEAIGAEYYWGRDFSVCVKPDGSMWKVP